MQLKKKKEKNYRILVLGLGISFLVKMKWAKKMSNLRWNKDGLYLEELWQVVEDGEEEDGDDVTVTVAHLNNINV